MIGAKPVTLFQGALTTITGIIRVAVRWMISQNFDMPPLGVVCGYAAVDCGNLGRLCRGSYRWRLSLDTRAVAARCAVVDDNRH